MGVTLPQMAKQIGKLFVELKTLRQSHLELEKRIAVLEARTSPPFESGHWPGGSE